MKKLKFALVSVAIVGAITAAFATRVKAPCDYMTQYVLVNGSYVLAGIYGLNYFCVGSLGVCTWYKPWSTSDWYPCRAGTYLPIEQLNKKK